MCIRDSSTNRNLRLTSTTRWRATALVQGSRPYSEEFIGQVRIADDSIDGTIGETVTTGAVVNGRVENNLRIVRYMIDGERIVTAKDPGPDGKPYRVRIGDIEYEANYEQDALRVGQAGDKKNCFKLKRYQVQDARFEQWAITFQNAFVTGERYTISRELLEPGQDGHWQIQKYETNLTVEETPVKSTVDIRSIDNPDRRATARARLETWSNGGKRWEVIDEGRNYLVDEVVEIGANGPEATVTGVKGNEDPNTDQEKSWSKMTEKGANYSPLNAICDYFINSTDDSSHATCPKHLSLIHISEPTRPY